ncbi:hypothetical protein BDQ12DRAFT_685070 [Crucibulum laeve]|uniref:SAP domain-containing protein n=1 Tax=Crucibulum laeve TaxID=68775 RepID=A0A5C3LXK8_9AGAR|nr:hypothetical protein BDQ12DRAFT_685070 [Crucibulum laeve]
MAPIAYTGALQPKKKSELQEIALSLGLSDQGTKDEVQGRIKKHLDGNPQLEDDPQFTGLYGRRKRSVQPQPAPSSTRFLPPLEPPLSNTKSFVTKHVNKLESLRESTPAKDLRDVSTFLKHPFSPAESTPDHSPRPNNEFGTPSSLPPLPPSPTKSLIEHFRSPPDVTEVVEHVKTHYLESVTEFITSLRAFLSNAATLWYLTALLELLYIVTTVIPWQNVQVPLTSKGADGFAMSIRYPPLTIFRTSGLWVAILHWAIPTLIIPFIVGNVISFNPTSRHHRSLPPFDTLTASIVRLAAQIMYPYGTITHEVDVLGLDVLGFRWRVLNASVGLAFAFAEAIAGAPQLFAKTLVRDRQYAISEGERTPSRRALTAEPASDEVE